MAQPDEEAISRRLAAARARLERRAGLAAPPPTPYHRPLERPFTAAERGRVTILFGGLTWKHERLIQAVLQSCGYHAEPLPRPDLSACLVGRHYGNNGVCNPAYFTVGNLLQYLQALEASGLSRQEIVDRYVYFTAGSCGPCRFGMYEAEFRLALGNAGFDGFRVLVFSQSDGVKASTGQPGFRLSAHLGLGALDAFLIADAVNAFAYATRPYEVSEGRTDAELEQAIGEIARWLRARPPTNLLASLPAWLHDRLPPRPPPLARAEAWVNAGVHLRGRRACEALGACTRGLRAVEVDRLRVKPVVKITGEFWAQSTEGDGNFRMFSFLEREGAHVLVEPLGGWVMYLLNEARQRTLARRGVDVPRGGPTWLRLAARASDEARALRKRWLFGLAERVYHHAYDRLRGVLGGAGHPLVDSREVMRLARPFYHHLARGGEGYTEVGKSIYYSTRNGAHLVLSLKPFGCMPSTQSDGVQSAVVARFKDLMFVPIETAADGELHAHSRVQMALVEARARADAEFRTALASTGKTLDDLRAYIDAHPVLRRADYVVPNREAVAGVAATFALHVSDLIDRDRGWRGARGGGALA